MDHASTPQPTGVTPRTHFKIGTRISQLAMVQTNQVASLLKAKFPHLEFEVVGVNTKGDQVLDVALSKIGDKGLFTKELEDGIVQGSLDFAVHSLKDIPTCLPAGLTIGAITKREKPNDVLIVNSKHKECTLATLPDKAVIGTSSLRRKSQLQKRFPHLLFNDIRGNLNTRLSKLDSGQYDALVLAFAGIDRLGLGDRIHETLDDKEFFYAVGQGALGVECRQDDNEVLAMLSSIEDSDTKVSCLAERSFLRELEGGCQIPVGVSSQLVRDEGVAKLVLHGIVLSIDGSQSVSGELSGPLSDAEAIGRKLAQDLISRGAGEILKEVRTTTSS